MRTAILAAATALTMLTGIAPAAAADYAGCQYVIAGRGHSHIAETREDVGPSRLGVSADAIARQRAVANWKANVLRQCPHHSVALWRAHEKNFDCDAGVGNRDCVFTARPARKVLGWVLHPFTKG